MSQLTAGPHEIEWVNRLETFFGGHTHLWDTKTGLCVADDCPSNKEQEEQETDE